MADGGDAPAASRRFTHGRHQRPQYAANGDKDAHGCVASGFELPQHRNRIGDADHRAGTCIGCRPVAHAVRAVQYRRCLARKSHLRCHLPAREVVIEVLHTPAHRIEDMTTELTDQAALVAKPAARAPKPCDSSGDDGKRRRDRRRTGWPGRAR